MKRLVAAVAVVALVLLTVGAALVATRGSGGSAGPPPVAPPAGGPPATKAPSASLARFYSQHVDWTSCGDGNDCAKLTVPLDYLHPAARTIRLALLKVPASGSRIGSLVVNPGGPGAGGTSYASGRGAYFGDPLLEHFDLVGFDPRGTGQSSPVDCLPDAQFNAYLSSDPDPDPSTPVQVAEFRRQQQRLARGVSPAPACWPRMSRRSRPRVTWTSCGLRSASAG